MLRLGPAAAPLIAPTTASPTSAAGRSRRPLALSLVALSLSLSRSTGADGLRRALLLRTTAPLLARRTRRALLLRGTLLSAPFARTMLRTLAAGCDGRQ